MTPYPPPPKRRLHHIGKPPASHKGPNQFDQCATREKHLAIRASRALQSRQPVISPFSNLPIELIFEIADYLPPASRLCLALCSRGLMNVLDDSNSLRKSPEFCYPRSLDSDIREPRTRSYIFESGFWKLLCQLEDSRFRCCSACVKLHPTNEFSEQALETRAKSRNCMFGALAGVVRLCPCVRMTFRGKIKLVDKLRERSSGKKDPPPPDREDVVAIPGWHQCEYAGGPTKIIVTINPKLEHDGELVIETIYTLTGSRIPFGLMNMPYFCCPHRSVYDHIDDITTLRHIRTKGDDGILYSNPRKVKCKYCLTTSLDIEWHQDWWTARITYLRFRTLKWMGRDLIQADKTWYENTDNAFETLEEYEQRARWPWGSWLNYTDFPFIRGNSIPHCVEVRVHRWWHIHLCSPGLGHHRGVSLRPGPSSPSAAGRDERKEPTAVSKAEVKPRSTFPVGSAAFLVTPLHSWTRCEPSYNFGRVRSRPSLLSLSWFRLGPPELRLNPGQYKWSIIPIFGLVFISGNGYLPGASSNISSVIYDVRENVEKLEKTKRQDSKGDRTTSVDWANGRPSVSLTETCSAFRPQSPKMDMLAALTSLLSMGIVYPASFLASFIYSLLEFLLRPLLHPLRQVYQFQGFLIRMVLKLEPAYTFFGTAIFFGAVAGYLLHCTLCSTYEALGVAPTSHTQLRLGKPGHLSTTKLKESESDESDTGRMSNNRPQGLLRKTGIRSRYPRWWMQRKDSMTADILEEEDDSQ
ncbi:predicted protein [Uncinocarpus reesii 1704]|uniref:F-box domain-containing protein n=1 Tax=Uncinocarpus reesii (strain UAMH 1704) TaxID=336963 RepID=C4JPY9_UNCRE|nr:uncharacterized protein UREG_04632 [Uncinocarpus reesii 1704]EEP79786.1 predicted protein [Uncinocarpus reesii 1704]